MVWYVVLVALVALERVAELVVSQRNAAWSFARGGIEFGRGHYPLLVVAQVGLLIGSVVEAYGNTFIPALGWPMLVLVVLAQALRWWCIGTLGTRWNTRVIVVPSLPLVASGPYRFNRFIRHPNYVAVVVEGFALPLVHTSWVTALGFTAVNLPLLAVRIRCENAALRQCSTS